MLTQSRIQVSVDINPILKTTIDFLRFVTMFFEVINQSGPHIYHSALLLAPQSSIIRKLYSQQIRHPVSRIVTGIHASWDSCTASVGVKAGVDHANWSPCGRFIAVRLGSTSADVVEVRDSSTLERVSVLTPPSSCLRGCPRSLTFSPDGHLLACGYYR